jgi:uncharacterized protein YdeI (YjbR/CyaY-like superfamily)
MKPTFFATPADFRRWLERNHDSVAELWVGFHKKATGKPSITWPESVDQALCFGWIDGVRKSVDPDSYMIRFTPRRTGSIWSTVNTKRVKELTRLGLMKDAGLKAFAARDEKKTKQYSFERDNVAFEPALEKRFRASRKAWKFFESQPPGYRKLATFYVMSAKQDATRQRRLDRLIADSEAGQRIGILGRDNDAR